MNAVLILQSTTDFLTLCCTVHWWKHRFLSECMNTVYDQSFGAKVPTYNLVLQLDRKLRGFHVPAILQIAGFGNPDTRGGAAYDSIPLILQRHLVLTVREASTCLFSVHRCELVGSDGHHFLTLCPDLLCMSNLPIRPG